MVMPPVNEETASAPSAATSQAESVTIPNDALIIVPVRNTVLFPGVVAPLPQAGPNRSPPLVARPAAIGILLQRNAEVDDPAPDQLNRICTVANIVRYVTAPDETHHIICQGVQRARILDFLPGTPFLAARVPHIPEPTTSSPEMARFLNLQRQAIEAIQLLPQAPPELIALFQSTTVNHISRGSR
jgi:ATP-dependent Lon protease